MKNVILYHLQNGPVKNAISPGRQLKFLSDAEFFESVVEPF